MKEISSTSVAGLNIIAKGKSNGKMLKRVRIAALIYAAYAGCTTALILSEDMAQLEAEEAIVSKKCRHYEVAGGYHTDLNGNVSEYQGGSVTECGRPESEKTIQTDLLSILLWYRAETLWTVSYCENRWYGCEDPVLVVVSSTHPIWDFRRGCHTAGQRK